MRFRWTVNGLKHVSNKKLIETLITERKSDCTNVYAPLYKRLSELERWVEKEVKNESEVKNG